MGQLTCFSTAGFDQIDLRWLFLIAPVGEECDLPSIGRPHRVVVGLVAEGVLPRAAARLGGDHPEVGVFLFGLLFHPLHGKYDCFSAWIDTRRGKNLEFVQIFSGDW